MLNQNNNSSKAIPRRGESEIPTSFRADRLFSIGTDWYFSTREGQDQGPFFSRQLAQNAIARYINETQKEF